MKRSVIGFLTFLLLVSVLVACSDMRYDTTENFDKDLTLFQKEISVPIGSIGPVTIQSLLGNSTIFETIASLMLVGDDGMLTLQSEQEIYAINVYRIEKEVDSVSTDFTFKAGDHSVNPGGLLMVLGMFGLECVGQKLEINATNPMDVRVPVRADVSFSCMNSSYETTFRAEDKLSQSMRRNLTAGTIFSTTLPADTKDLLSSVGLNNLEFDLPANPTTELADENVNDIFSFKSRLLCNVGLGEEFKFPYALTVDDAKLNIGKFKLHKCEVTVEVENTLPAALKLNSVKVLNEQGAEDENISVSGDLVIAGGSLEKPAVTNLTLVIEAKEGTVPDIHGLQIDLEAASQPGCQGVALSVNQGLYVKSSSAKLSGGITIPFNML